MIEACLSSAQRLGRVQVADDFHTQVNEANGLIPDYAFLGGPLAIAGSSNMPVEWHLYATMYGEGEVCL